MIERYFKNYRLGLLTVYDIYEDAKMMYYDEKITLSEYKTVIEFCEDHGLKRTDIVYNYYKRIMDDIARGSLDISDLKTARSWKSARSAALRYCGCRIEDAWIKENYAIIRRHSRNDANIRKVVDRIDGGSRRVNWARKKWGSAGLSTRMEIMLRAKWDKTRAMV